MTKKGWLGHPLEMPELTVNSHQNLPAAGVEQLVSVENNYIVR